MLSVSLTGLRAGAETKVLTPEREIDLGGREARGRQRLRNVHAPRRPGKEERNPTSQVCLSQFLQPWKAQIRR